jgi:hypothetical protein
MKNGPGILLKSGKFSANGLKMPSNKFLGNRPQLPYRGGNWNNTSNAGVFYLNLNNGRSNSNNNRGFRSALSSKPEGINSRINVQRRGQRGLLPSW